MAKKPEHELSEMTRIINQELASCPPPEIPIHPPVFTRDLTPAELERREQEKRLLDQYRVKI